MVWVECKSWDIETIDKYIKHSKIYNDDYKGKNLTEEEAFLDFKKWIAQYEKQYQEFSEKEKKLV